MPGNSNNSLNGTRNVQSYVGVNAPQPPNVILINRSPTTSDKKNVYVGDFWINTVTKAMYTYVGNDSQGLAQWPLVTSGSGDVVSISDTNDTKALPDASGNIQLAASPMGGATVTTSGINPSEIFIGLQNTQEPTGQTTDATPLALYSFTVPPSSGYAFYALVHGVKSDFTDAASFLIMRGIRRAVAGAPVLIGATSQFVCSDADPAVTCDVSISGNDVQLTVTGLVATTYNWSASLKWVEVI